MSQDEVEAGAEVRPRSVFVTVGTDHHPFDRLIGWMDEWVRGANAECFVQYGTSRAPSSSPGAPYLTHEETRRRIGEAGAVVCHGGPGTIMDSLSFGTKPVVVPRRREFGEHVDDHQVRFTQRLARDGYIAVARSSTELTDLIEEVWRSPINSAGGDEVPASVARFASLMEDLLRPRAR